MSRTPKATVSTAKATTEAKVTKPTGSQRSSGSSGSKAAPAATKAAATKVAATKTTASKTTGGKTAAGKGPAESKAAAAVKTPAATKTATATRPPAATKTAKAKPVQDKSAGKKAPHQAHGRGFLDSQRVSLLAERDNYLRHADELKAEADSLALEHEPGDVQFDEEGGEGGTSNVDRELDLVLSAQARAAIDEIDRAFAKIDAGTYGACERCGDQIPEARLEALPHASLCVTCKSGGLASRR